MEPLREHQQEISYEYNRATGFEKQFVWDSAIEQAFTRVHDHEADERYNVYAREGAHARTTYDRPMTQLHIHIGDEAMQQTIAFEPVNGDYDGA